MRYFDSSAVVKLYLDEPDSHRVREWFGQPRSAVSRLTEVEVASALSRAAREGLFNEARGETALQNLRSDLVQWDVVELTTEVVSEAVRVLARHPLTAGDAIQLATALVYERQMGEPLEAFVAFDRRLTRAARAERLRVLPA